MRRTASAVAAFPDLSLLGERFKESVDAFEECLDWIVRIFDESPLDVHASAVPFLLLCGC